MKVLLVNGSARVHGNTATALQQIAQTLETEASIPKSSHSVPARIVIALPAIDAPTSMVAASLTTIPLTSF